MAAMRNLLVTGATGKQGGALIASLLASPSSPFKLYGLTRNTSSPRSRTLASQNVTMIQGDTTRPSDIFARLPPIWGVFSVTLPGQNEEAQAIPLIDESIKHGVKHFVFTSADRGNEKSDEDPTTVPHFITKFNIEKHLKAEAAKDKGGMTWTILRPVAFFDNLTPDLIGKAFARMVQQMEGVKLAMVGTKNIGRVAATVFLEDDKYRGKAFPIVGDQMDFEEMQKIFRKTVGKDLQLAPGFLASFFKWAVSDLGIMFAWFKKGGYAWDTQEARKAFPDLEDFATWLRDSSKFETTKERSS